MTNRCQSQGLQLSEVAAKDIGQRIVRLPKGLQLSKVAVKDVGQRIVRLPKGLQLSKVAAKKCRTKDYPTPVGTATF